jgi:hypothetical protein
MVFLYPFDSKVTRTRGRRLQDLYLMNVNRFRKSLIVYLFFFSQFSLLLLFSVSPSSVGFSPPVLDFYSTPSIFAVVQPPLKLSLLSLTTKKGTCSRGLFNSL